jgi:hypothetical protein
MRTNMNDDIGYQGSSQEQLEALLGQLQKLLDEIIERADFLPEEHLGDIRLGWADAQEAFGVARRAIHGLDSATHLRPVGLDDDQLKMKISTWRRLRRRYEDLMTEVRSSGRRLQGAAGHRIKRIAVPLLKIGDVVLGSLGVAGVLAGLPPVFEPLKEIKDVVEAIIEVEPARS